jgi:dTDP-4-amino-4,6-dideoxygalactose transaminase
MENLNQNEIYPGVHYRDNLEYEMYSYARGTCPKAHELSESILSLPMHMNLTKTDVDYICKTINDFTRR